jgi:hypothetical protein
MLRISTLGCSIPLGPSARVMMSDSNWCPTQQLRAATYPILCAVAEVDHYTTPQPPLPCHAALHSQPSTVVAQLLHSLLAVTHTTHCAVTHTTHCYAKGTATPCAKTPLAAAAVGTAAVCNACIVLGCQ